jgi:hypothetical protein
MIERLLAIEEYASAYRAHLQKLAITGLNLKALRERREFLRPLLEEAGQAERASAPVDLRTTRPATGMGLHAPELWPLVEQRAEAIKLQLEGKQAGFKPDFRNPKRVLAEWAPLTVAAVTFMTAADADGDRRLSDPEVRTAIQRVLAAAKIPAEESMDRVTALAAIEKLIPTELGRRVPAAAWSDWLLAVADPNKDGRVNAEEMFATYHRFQIDSDRDRDGRMDGRDLIEALEAAGAPRDPDPARK